MPTGYRGVFLRERMRLTPLGGGLEIGHRVGAALLKTMIKEISFGDSANGVRNDAKADCPWGRPLEQR